MSILYLSLDGYIKTYPKSKQESYYSTTMSIAYFPIWIPFWVALTKFELPITAESKVKEELIPSRKTFGNWQVKIPRIRARNQDFHIICI